MKTEVDLRLLYKRETGLEVILTAYGFRPYLTWLEERLLKELNQSSKLAEAKRLLGKYCKLTEFGPLQGIALYAEAKAFIKDTELPS